MCWRCASAPHWRRRPFGLAKPSASISFPLKRFEGKGFGAQHRKREWRVGHFWPPRPEVGGAAAFNREDREYWSVLINGNDQDRLSD
jgi:hypothetical protein